MSSLSPILRRPSSAFILDIECELRRRLVGAPCSVGDVVGRKPIQRYVTEYKRPMEHAAEQAVDVVGLDGTIGLSKVVPFRSGEGPARPAAADSIN
jgi:hypothetical protein